MTPPLLAAPATSLPANYGIWRTALDEMGLGVYSFLIQAAPSVDFQLMRRLRQLWYKRYFLCRREEKESK